MINSVLSSPLDRNALWRQSCSTMTADQTNAPADLPTDSEDTKREGHSLFGDVAAIIGFIILIVVVIWGLVHLISLGGGWVSSLSGRSNAAIQVTAPGSARSGEPVTVTWKYTPAVTGSYAFLYPCRDGLSFKAAPPIGVSGSYAIPCGAAYTMPLTNNSLIVTPTLTASSSVVTSLSIVFLPNATGTAATAGEAQGATTITITAGSPQVQPEQRPQPQQPEKTPAKTTARTVYRGPADLAISDISGSVDGNGNATASFTIANIGGSNSGSYYFTASLPSASGSYTSPVQSSLAPGDRIVNTLNFGPVNSGGGLFIATVIPSGADVNSANNSGSFNLVSSYSGAYNYNNGYPVPAYTSYSGGAYYPNSYPYTPQPCGYGGYGTYSGYPCQNQPLYYTQNSQPYYNYPYNQYQPYYYQY